MQEKQKRANIDVSAKHYQKELGSRKYRQKVEETGGVLFIDQYRMKIMPQVKYNYCRKEI